MFGLSFYQMGIIIAIVTSVCELLEGLCAMIVLGGHQTGFLSNFLLTYISRISIIWILALTNPLSISNPALQLLCGSGAIIFSILAGALIIVLLRNLLATLLLPKKEGISNEQRKH